MVPIVISAISLVFTVASFYWLFARRGTLISYEPHTFGAGFTSTKSLFRLPLVFENTGPRPIIVQNLRMAFLDEIRPEVPLIWSASRSSLQMKEQGDHQMPAVFAVPGRDAIQLFIEFMGEFPDVKNNFRDYDIQIDVILGNDSLWQNLLSFQLHAGHITAPEHYIVYSNLCGQSIEGHERLKH